MAATPDFSQEKNAVLHKGYSKVFFKEIISVRPRKVDLLLCVNLEKPWCECDLFAEKN